MWRTTPERYKYAVNHDKDTVSGDGNLCVSLWKQEQIATHQCNHANHIYIYSYQPKPYLPNGTYRTHKRIQAHTHTHADPNNVQYNSHTHTRPTSWAIDIRQQKLFAKFMMSQLKWTVVRVEYVECSLAHSLVLVLVPVLYKRML